MPVAAIKSMRSAAASWLGPSGAKAAALRWAAAAHRGHQSREHHRRFAAVVAALGMKLFQFAQVRADQRLQFTRPRIERMPAEEVAERFAFADQFLFQRPVRDHRQLDAPRLAALEWTIARANCGVDWHSRM